MPGKSGLRPAQATTQGPGEGRDRHIPSVVNVGKPGENIAARYTLLVNDNFGHSFSTRLRQDAVAPFVPLGPLAEQCTHFFERYRDPRAARQTESLDEVEKFLLSAGG